MIGPKLETDGAQHIDIAVVDGFRGLLRPHDGEA